MAQPEPLRRYLEVQQKFDTNVRGVLERAARDIRQRINGLGQGIGADVRRAQLQSVLFQIRNIQQDMWTHGVLGATVRGQRAAADAAQDIAETMDRVLYTALPANVAETVRDGLDATARAGIELDHARVPRQLSARVYHDFALTSGQVEQTIRSGIVSGLSARELAGDVYKFISPTTPGGASYAAMRLARTEINNAFHEQQIKGAERPGVLGVVWNLSGSHKVPDKCNDYARHEVWQPKEVPGKPHPHCLCFLTYKTMKPDEFATAFNRGDFDAELDKRTQANLARQRPLTIEVRPKSDVSPRIRAKAEKMIAKPTMVDHIKTGVVKEQRLGGGLSADTSRVTFKDGTQAILKKAKQGAQRDPIESQDAEEIVSAFGRNLGIDIPGVVRTADDTVFMELVEGKTIPELSIFERRIADIERLADSDDGRRIALMDLVTGNVDRNKGNWMVRSDGRLIPIDHGMAFQDWAAVFKDRPLDVEMSFITGPVNDLAHRLLNGSLGPGDVFQVTGGTKNFTRNDLQALRRALTKTKNEFRRLKHLDWYEGALRRLDFLEQFASGKGKGLF